MKPRDFLNDLVSRGSWPCECIIWPHARYTDGYAQIREGGAGSKKLRATRVICERLYGPPPTPKHQAAHSCGKGHEGCVNPDHLRWATDKENKADRLLHGTDQFGERNPRAKLTEEQVREIRASKKTQRELAAIYNVNSAAICMIRTGKRWRRPSLGLE